MVALPPSSGQQVINRVYAGYEKEDRKPDLYLGRIGASSVGEECVRRVWLDWRGFARESPEGRILRLFQTGHLQEARIVEDLRRAGFSVWDKRPGIGKQFEYTDATGHAVTKIDGIIKGVPDAENTPHLLEIKSHNQKSFDDLVKKGVRESKPLHYAQMIMSMWLSEFDRGLYVAVNKNDESLYVERVKPDAAVLKSLQTRITSMTKATLRPAGISDDGSSFGCKFCPMKAVCTGQEKPLRHCRTCRHAEPGPEGAWVCGLTSATMSIDTQRLGCPEYDAL